MHEALRQVALHESGTGLASPDLRRTIRQQALSRLVALASQGIAADTGIRPSLTEPCSPIGRKVIVQLKASFAAVRVHSPTDLRSTNESATADPLAES
ncbi:hypothetical protein [Falsiroseomonas sp. HW251]|uniref:hypothetical protein n=1 Tax=Falsiroseomonas sp. HW251 TaxID=3390998 RepID=UPI003D310136